MTDIAPSAPVPAVSSKPTSSGNSSSTVTSPDSTLANVSDADLQAELASRAAKKLAETQTSNAAIIAPLKDFFLDNKAYTLSDLIDLLRTNASAVITATQDAEGNSPFQVHLQGLLTILPSAQAVGRDWISSNTPAA